MAEAKYYLVQGLADECQAALQVPSPLGLLVSPLTLYPFSHYWAEPNCTAQAWLCIDHSCLNCAGKDMSKGKYQSQYCLSWHNGVKWSVSCLHPHFSSSSTSHCLYILHIHRYGPANSLNLYLSVRGLMLKIISILAKICLYHSSIFFFYWCSRTKSHTSRSVKFLWWHHWRKSRDSSPPLIRYCWPSHASEWRTRPVFTSEDLVSRIQFWLTFSCCCVYIAHCQTLIQQKQQQILLHQVRESYIY